MLAALGPAPYTPHPTPHSPHPILDGVLEMRYCCLQAIAAPIEQHPFLPLIWRCLGPQTGLPTVLPRCGRRKLRARLRWCLRRSQRRPNGMGVVCGQSVEMGRQLRVLELVVLLRRWKRSGRQPGLGWECHMGLERRVHGRPWLPHAWVRDRKIVLVEIVGALLLSRVEWWRKRGAGCCYWLREPCHGCDCVSTQSPPWRLETHTEGLERAEGARAVPGTDAAPGQE